MSISDYMAAQMDLNRAQGRCNEAQRGVNNSLLLAIVFLLFGLVLAMAKIWSMDAQCYAVGFPVLP